MEEVADTFVLLKEKFRLMRNFRMNEMKGMSAKDFFLAPVCGTSHGCMFPARELLF